MNENIMMTSPYLRGWKEIATYLKTSVRTVQRWEKIGLPIHRIGPMKVGGVFAIAEELDGWLRTTGPVAPPHHIESATPIQRFMKIPQ